MIYRHKSSVQVLSDLATAAVGQGIAPETSAGGAVCVSRLMLAVSDSINKLVIDAVHLPAQHPSYLDNLLHFF